MGQVFVPAPVSAPKTPSAFYESNANDGSIVRINLGKPFTFDTIATGLPVNHGVPGSILAPSGLTYDRQRDVLYVVDGAVNALIAIWGPATIRAGGIVVQNGTIGGPQKERMKIIARGGWLNNPISAALLFNGDIVVGNTANNNLLEFTRTVISSARVRSTRATPVPSSASSLQERRPRRPASISTTTTTTR